MRFLLRVIMCFLTAISLNSSAQAAFRARPINNEQPSARYQPAMAFDSARKNLVLFGGMNAQGEHLADTWVWDGKTWIKLDAGGPQARSGHAMTYDSHRQRVILFGGVSSAGQLGDLWEWDGKDWMQVTLHGPAARVAPQLAYDGRRKKTVLFGGLDTTSKRSFGDTWEWDGRAWKQASATTPEARFHHLMAYDEARGRTVLFGGNISEGQFDMEKYKAGQRGDTWEWDGKRWTQFDAPAPSKRDHHAMAYDRARRQVVLFGGFDGAYLGDTWGWNGKQWRKLSSIGPPVRGGKPAMAYDDSRRKVLLFGGGVGGGTALTPQAFNDLWEWNGRSWAKLK